MDDWTDWILFRRVHYDMIDRTTSRKRKCPFKYIVQHRNIYVQRTMNWIHTMFDDQSKS